MLFKFPTMKDQRAPMPGDTSDRQAQEATLPQVWRTPHSPLAKKLHPRGPGPSCQPLPQARTGHPEGPPGVRADERGPAADNAWGAGHQALEPPGGGGAGRARGSSRGTRPHLGTSTGRPTGPASPGTEADPGGSGARGEERGQRHAEGTGRPRRNTDQRGCWRSAGRSQARESAGLGHPIPV